MCSTSITCYVRIRARVDSSAVGFPDEYKGACIMRAFTIKVAIRVLVRVRSILMWYLTLHYTRHEMIAVYSKVLSVYVGEGSLQNPSRPNPMGKMAYTQLYVLNYSWYILTADIGIISKFGSITIEIYLK